VTTPRVLWVYPAYAAARTAEEEAWAARMRDLGADVRAFGIPCPGGWWPFAQLDARYRDGDRALHAAYEALARELDAPGAVLVAAGGAMLHPAFLDQLRVPKLFVCADDPENSANLSRPVAAHFDHCFVVNIACVDDYRAWGARSAEWLFPVLRPERRAAGITERRVLYGARDVELAMCCDRAFGGGDRRQRLDRLLAQFPQCETRGRGWPAGEVGPREVAELYARTKIGWNLHHSIGPCNTRLLELPANGVLQLCDNRAHLGRIFELGREVVGFDTVAECIDATRYYLAHDDERRAIAAAGLRRVQRDYTEERQWQRIAAVAERLLAARAPVPAKVIPHHRPKVWLLADRRGWAYDREAQAMAEHLAPEFECRIAYVQEQPDLALWDFDLVWVFFWGETWHQRFVRDPRRVVKMVGSHRWQNEAAWGLLDPATFAATHLHDAGTIAAISQRLQRLVAPFRAAHLVPQGIDARAFAPAAPPFGELRVGWAGNRDDACKGLADVLQPACVDRWELRVAGGDLAPAAVAAFHQQLDVLCVASTAEGGPLPLLEALACGAFVVTTDVGIAREVIRDRNDGLIVERTPAAFRAALHWCEANVVWLRATRAERAARLHAERNWERVADARADVLRAAYAALPRRDAKATAIEQLQTAYRDHLQQVSGADENTFAAAAVYYRAELQALLPESRDAHIVEVGCGFGHLLRFLAERGYRDLCGVDLDRDLAAATAQRLAGRAAVHCAEARAFLAAHEGAFDLVLAYDILEHFDLDGALAFATAARRALRPGGHAVFRTPNMANLLGCYSRYMDLTHRIGLTEQSARQLLTAAGFADVAIVAAQHEPGPLCSGIAASRALHEQLFAQQDRSRPTCFDKNLVVAAGVPVAATRDGVAAASGARA